MNVERKTGRSAGEGASGTPDGRPAASALAWRWWTRLVALALVATGFVACEPPAEAQTEPGAHFVRIESDDVVSRAYSSPSASWVDVDADGDQDLYVLNGYPSLADDPEPQPDGLYRNRGDGTFEAVPGHDLVADTSFSGSATWADFDNDGDVDVFVADQRGADNRLYRNEGLGSFVRVEDGPVVSDGGRSFSAVWVDVDVDGRLDLHVLNGRDGSGGQEDFVYRNRGDGTFERVPDLPFAAEALPSGGAAWGDYDADGDPDLFLPVHATSRRARLYRNDGGWTFTEVSGEAGLTSDPLPFYPRTSVAHWVDYDNDLDLDLFVGNTGGTLDYLYENDGEGGFRTVTAGRVGLDATYVSDATWTDVDNDADRDLVVAVWGGASELYLNDGSGALEPADGGEFGDVVTFASSVSAGDVDGDGARDLYLTQWPINEEGGAPNLLYRNRGGAGNWVRVALEGTTSNRSGIGARIVVVARVNGEVVRQLRHVAARTSWRSADALTRHFGLGDAERIDSLVVTWPSGRVDRIAGPIEVNRRLTVVEGEGLLSEEVEETAAAGASD